MDEQVLFSEWFILGEKKDRGTVDIACRAGDVLYDVPRGLADEILKLRDAFLEKQKQFRK